MSGILFGIGISLFGYNYLNGKRYATLNQDLQLSNGGILRKGIKIKYNAFFQKVLSNTLRNKKYKASSKCLALHLKPKAAAIAHTPASTADPSLLP